MSLPLVHRALPKKSDEFERRRIQLVTITGQPTGIQIAVRLLYQRLEQEKQKREFTLLLIGRIVSASMLIYRGSIGTELGA